MKALQMIIANSFALITLFISYRIFILKKFSYYGYGVEVYYPHIFIAIISMLIAIVLLLNSKKWQSFFDIQCLLSLYPGIILYIHNSVQLEYIVYCLLLLFASWVSLEVIPQFRTCPQVRQRQIFSPMIIVIGIISALIMFKSFGFRVNFSFYDVYSIRESNKGTVSGLLVYLVRWIPLVVFPLLIIYCGILRKFFFLFLFIILQIAFFMSTGHKSYLIPVFIGLLFFVKYKIYSQAYFIYLFSIFVLFVTFIGSVNGMLASLFVRRMIFYPIFIQGKFFDYVKINGNVERVSGEPSALIIADFMGRMGEYTNGGFLANAYLYYGHTGTVIFILFGAILFKVVLENLPLAGIDYFTKFMIIYWFSRPVFSSELQVSLISHGVALTVILTLFFNRFVKWKGLKRA